VVRSRSSNHVLPPDGDAFWAEVQEDYDAVVPSPENRPPPPPEDVSDLASEFQAAGLTSVAVRRHVWDVTYGADEYLEVLDTYSGNRVLDPATRARLFERIHARIESRPSREVRKTYLATLTVGKRRRT
jgi:hypothetical protein